jgi:hypothetical protein
VDNQNIFNVGILIVGSLSGWLMRIMWCELKMLQHNDKDLMEKISGIEVLVAGQYVKRDDMDKTTAALFAKLDRIEDKIDKKADK